MRDKILEESDNIQWIENTFGGHYSVSSAFNLKQRQYFTLDGSTKFIFIIT
jgi:hypothetical protein